MKDFNVTMIEGRTTKLPELKYTINGTPKLAFSLAVNYSIRDGDGWKDQASFFDCEYFGKGAESVSRYIGKGTKLLIQGEFRQDRWEQDGQPRSKIKLLVNDLRIQDFHRDKPEETGGVKPSTLRQIIGNSPPKFFDETAPKPQTIPAGDMFDDDIPF
jgi:single-strand DNA-binding protein